VVRSSPIILAIRRGNSADTLAGGLTPKAIIWNVMQITKIHFCDLASFGGREPRSSTVQGGGKRRADVLLLAWGGYAHATT
jgi:hypothetical protein